VVNELRRVGAEWGIECTRYEVKDIDPPLEIMSAMKVRRCGRVGGWVRSGAARDASEHITSTSIRHIHPSHPSVTSTRHIHPSHPPFHPKAEAEAERKKRAAILDSEGVRQACTQPYVMEACSPMY
jgi:regulator of protease activity HflC (stomatin/prohibitin superfamily)